MRLSRKVRASLRRYWSSRGQMMLLWSHLGSYEIPDGIYKDMERKYRLRAKQALDHMLKNIGFKNTKALLDEKERKWKSSGEWRQYMPPRKPDPLLLEIETGLKELEELPPGSRSEGLVTQMT